ncbi:MAG TPA: hypothetical protein VJ697_11330 [Nitrososphaeraceae archaeon]|nr:hypothetical protein [Nitrososphaeraceae archaeon]
MIKKLFDILRSDQEDNLLSKNQANEFKEYILGSSQALGSIINVAEKTKEQLDILFTQYVIQKRDILKLINTLVKMTRNNSLLNIRILLPSPKLDEEDVPSNIYPNISIKYFDRRLSEDRITTILDSKFMYIMGSNPDHGDDLDRFFIQGINDEPKILTAVALFERMWMLEKSVDFG